MIAHARPLPSANAQPHPHSLPEASQAGSASEFSHDRLANTDHPALHDSVAANPRETAQEQPARDPRSHAQSASDTKPVQKPYVSTEKSEGLGEETRFLKSQVDEKLGPARQLVAYCQADPDLWDYVYDPARILIQTKLNGKCSSADQLLQVEFQVAKLRQTASELAGEFDSPTIRLLARRAAIAMLIEDWMDRLRAQTELTIPQSQALTRSQEMIASRVCRSLRILQVEKKLQLTSKRQTNSGNPRQERGKRDDHVDQNGPPTPIPDPRPETDDLRVPAVPPNAEQYQSQHETSSLN